MMNIALITSTIEPKQNVFELKRNSVSDRLKDYETSFTFYCGLLKNGKLDKVVYVDNSNYSLSSLESIARELNVTDKVEFISYQSFDSPELSRFFLEINLLKYGMNTSRTILEANNPVIWKITGRYLIKNIDKIIGEFNQNIDVLINFRNKPYKVVDFYLVGFTKTGFDYLIKDLSLYEDKPYGELTLREKLEKNNQINFKVKTRFKNIPRIFGVRGIDNQSYSNPINNFKYYIRVILNRFFPQLWL